MEVEKRHLLVRERTDLLMDPCSLLRKHIVVLGNLWKIKETVWYTTSQQRSSYVHSTVTVVTIFVWFFIFIYLELNRATKIGLFASFKIAVKYLVANQMKYIKVGVNLFKLDWITHNWNLVSCWSDLVAYKIIHFNKLLLVENHSQSVYGLIWSWFLMVLDLVFICNMLWIQLDPKDTKPKLRDFSY